MDGNDPVCLDTGKGPDRKWLIKVLYRDADKGTVLRILDAGPQIMGQVKRLHEDTENFGDVSKYDVIIVRGPKDSRPLYTVQATGTADHPQPLSQEEIQLVKDSSDPQSDNFIDVDKMCEPWTAERIQAVLDGEDPRQTAQMSKPAAVTTATNTATDESEGGEVEGFFELEL